MSTLLDALRHTYCTAASPLPPPPPPPPSSFPQLSCKPSPARSAAAAILATLLGGKEQNSSDAARATDGQGKCLSSALETPPITPTTSSTSSHSDNTLAIAGREAWSCGVGHGVGELPPSACPEWSLPFPGDGGQSLVGAGCSGGGGGGCWGSAIEKGDGGGGKSPERERGARATGRLLTAGNSSPWGLGGAGTPASANIARRSPRRPGSPRARLSNDRCGDGGPDGDDVVKASATATVTAAEEGGVSERVGRRAAGWTPSPAGGRVSRKCSRKRRVMAGGEAHTTREDGVGPAGIRGSGGGDLFVSSPESVGWGPGSGDDVGCNTGTSSSTSTNTSTGVNGHGSNSYSRKDKVRFKILVYLSAVEVRTV